MEIKKNRTLYSATKWGMRGFFNSLKTNSSAKVLDVYPSNIQTRIYQFIIGQSGSPTVSFDLSTSTASACPI